MTPERAVEWMAERGILSYQGKISALQRQRKVPVLMLEKIDKEIAEIQQEALDRYDDWKTDPLP